MEWDAVVRKVAPYVVRIDTPTGNGTGYLCAYGANSGFVGIATALHVVQEADDWQQPIRIHNHDFTKRALFKESERVIWSDPANDSAVVLCPGQHLGLPQSLIDLRPLNEPLNIGAEIGWLGYPGIDAFSLCFFSGSISARKPRGYLVDGVAIHGVSGGPVFYSTQTDGVQFVGIVSAYRANRQSGQALPGLLVAQDVSHFHTSLDQFRTLEEAAKARTAMKEQQQAQAQTPPPPTPLPPPQIKPAPPDSSAPPSSN